MMRLLGQEIRERTPGKTKFDHNFWKSRNMGKSNKSEMKVSPIVSGTHRRALRGEAV